MATIYKVTKKFSKSKRAHVGMHVVVHVHVSNLTEGSAGLTRSEPVPKNDVTYFWCIRSPSNYWAVLKNRYFSPCSQ